MGLIGTVINALHTGGTLYQWPTESFLRSPGRWVTLVGELEATVAIAPPFALELVTRRWRRRGGEADLSRLRHLLVGAEQIRPEVIESFGEVFEPFGLRPDALCPTYGLAEGDARRQREAARHQAAHRRRRAAPLGLVRSADPGRQRPARPGDERAAGALARARWTDTSTTRWPPTR